MALGRKRRWTGWGLITLGISGAGLLLASRWFTFCCIIDPDLFIKVTSGIIEVWRVPTQVFRAAGNGNFDVSSGARPELYWSPPQQARGSIELVVDLGIFVLHHAPMSPSLDIWIGYVTLWPFPLAALAGGAPMLLSVRRSIHRARQGQCPVCGYSLAGLAPGAGCPECGRSNG